MVKYNILLTLTPSVVLADLSLFVNSPVYDGVMEGGTRKIWMRPYRLSYFYGPCLRRRNTDIYAKNKHVFIVRWRAMRKGRRGHALLHLTVQELGSEIFKTLREG